MRERMKKRGMTFEEAAHVSVNARLTRLRRKLVS
jgi:hypothetical protein